MDGTLGLQDPGSVTKSYDQWMDGWMASRLIKRLAAITMTTCICGDSDYNPTDSLLN